ncbi:C40 family peptidase [Streptomyces hirsutus]
MSLPRTTYAQINAGRRVARSELRPGDLVFFYSGITHVGLYIGNGRMIHAPNSGSTVRVAPLTEMPFAGATRVA